MPKRNKRDQDGIFARPDSPFWWASFTDGRGKPTRRSTGVRCDEDSGKERAAALRAQWVLEASIQRQSGGPAEAPVHTFDELMLAYLAGPGKEKKDTERDRYSARRLFSFFTGCVLEQLKGADVRAYIARRRGDGVSDSTINKEIGLLQTALNWARRDLEWDLPNPVEGRKLKEPHGRTRWLSRGEAAALLDAAKTVWRAPHLVDFVRLGLFTGMRPGEMLQLEWRRIDLKEGLIYLEAGNQKNGKVGSVPTNKEAARAIRRRARFRAKYCPRSPWVFCNRKGERIASVKTGFQGAVRKAGLEDVHPHDLRRTCGSWLVQKGVPIQAVSALLRHSDIRITDQVYAHLAPATVRAAIEMLDGNRKGVSVSRSVSR